MTSRLLRYNEAARRQVWDITNYRPSQEQLVAHLDLHRFRLVAGGERAGKSRFSAEELLIWLFTDGRAKSLFWIVAPDYSLARPEFQHLVNGLQKTGLLKADTLRMPAQGPCSLETVFGASVVTKSSVDVETLAGVAPAGILMVEVAQQTYESFLRCRGRVAEKRGVMALSGTFEGSLGWMPEVWTRWQGENSDGGRSFSLPTWSNLVLYPGGRDDPEIKALEATYPPDVFQERFGAVPCKPATLVFKDFDVTVHVRPCPYDPRLEVSLFVDPGYAGAYAVLAVQIHGDDVWVIDEVYERGVVVYDIIKACRQRPWWSRAKRIVMDIAGTQHQGMDSHADIWYRETKLPVYWNVVSVADGILRHKTYLMPQGPGGKPRLYHDPRCKSTIWEYNNYRYQETKENRPERELPLDANNHSMKAIAYGLIAMFGLVDGPSDAHKNIPIEFIFNREVRT
jgi:hypothetical protein